MAAFTISSETHSTASSIKALFNYLSDFKNFKDILPEDKVENFQYSGDSCSFTIRGITSLSVKMAEKNPYTHILFQTVGLAKFDFTLKAVFEGGEDAPGKCRVELTGDMNPFIKAMAEKPLTALVNTMSLKMSQLQLTV